MMRYQRRKLYQLWLTAVFYVLAAAVVAAVPHLVAWLIALYLLARAVLEIAPYWRLMVFYPILLLTKSWGEIDFRRDVQDLYSNEQIPLLLCAALLLWWLV